MLLRNVDHFIATHGCILPLEQLMDDLHWLFGKRSTHVHNHRFNPRDKGKLGQQDSDFQRHRLGRKKYPMDCIYGTTQSIGRSKPVAFAVWS